MSIIVKSFLLFLLPTVFGSPLASPDPTLSPKSTIVEERDNKFVWGSLGDSWASGVSFNGEKTDYDGDMNGCHRWKDTYGAVMERNTSWVTGVQEFHMAACSAARLVNIVAQPQGDNPEQINQVGKPQMLTYQAGGNNCAFGSVVEACLYQGRREVDYGAEYPNNTGLCAQLVAKSNDYINKPDEGGLYADEIKTVRDVLRNGAVKDNKDFRFYILGYAHFFNLGENYCDKSSFSPRAWIGLPGPKVSNQLRTDMNDGIQRVNDVLRRVVNDVGDPRVKFLDISPRFDKHRFCENHHNYNDQFYNTDVWLWNLNLPMNDPPANPELMNLWLNGTQILPDGTLMKDYFDNNEAFIGSETQGGVELDGGSGGSGGSGGTWQQRPFHPKLGGTQEIADAIIRQAMEDKIPGVVGSSPPTTGACDCNENGCSPESPACCANGTC